MEIKVHPIIMRMSLAYLVESVNGLVLVDAGSPGDEGRVLRRMEELGRDDLRLIFITHAHLDHYGCAAALRRLTGAAIAVHHADSEAMGLGDTRLGTARGRGRLLVPLMPLVERFVRPEPTAADILLDDGDDLANYGLAAFVLHTPGHTHGSSCLIVKDRIAFSGDLVTNTRTPRLQRLYAQDWSKLPQSLGRLQAQDVDLVYPGHGQRPINRGEILALEGAQL